MTHTNLRILDTETLLRHAYAQLDDLTTSDMERELLRRLEARETEAVQALDDIEFSAEELRTLNKAMDGCEAADADDVAKLLNAITGSQFSIKAVIGFVQMLTGSGITEPDELKTALELAQKFQQVANDLAEALPRLTTLITETAI